MKSQTKKGQRPLMRLDEVAELQGVCTKTVRRQIHSGQLTAILVGGQYRVDPVDYARFLQRRRGLHAPKKTKSGT
jgi:excisionase family DNA binding protein